MNDRTVDEAAAPDGAAPGADGAPESARSAPRRRRRSAGRGRAGGGQNPAASADERDEDAAAPGDGEGAGGTAPREDAAGVRPEPRGAVRFAEMGLRSEILRAVEDLGFTHLTPIQARALPFSLRGHDLVGRAQTGTGKTAAFLITILQDLLDHPLPEARYAGEARALVIAPTRELVLQIAEDARALARHTELGIHTLVGGMDYERQKRRLLAAPCDILVATPGRLLDFLGSGDVHLDRVEILVIDEADRMLDMGFIPQVRRIVRATPPKTHRQTLFFSATFTADVDRLAEQWTRDAVRVEIEPEKVATDTVEQRVYLVSQAQKFELLANILAAQEVESAIVFANRRDQCRRLAEKLRARGLSVGLLSGEVAQNRRVKTLEDFKAGRFKVLVATDVAGRGIHIEGVSHVINYTLPEEPEDYVHRIGRTGRAGRSGVSISFACEEDAFRLEPIQALLGYSLRCEQPPEALLA
ncbi:MAG: ATP-dependent RNA helicase RhlB [Porticoccaceae bacterium]|nr:MAG: ATP-dependent RNA helicase RhlB [Porticoccaceae bacterium]